jgi:hypothetical protein
MKLIYLHVLTQEQKPHIIIYVNSNRIRPDTMSKQIETAFYALEETGKSLEDCFVETAKQFNITTDDVVDALNEAAIS